MIHNGQDDIFVSENDKYSAWYNLSAWINTYSHSRYIPVFELALLIYTHMVTKIKNVSYVAIV